MVSCGSDGGGEWGRPDAPITIPDVVSDPGNPDPGTVDPGVLDLEAIDPGPGDPGNVDPGNIDTGPADPGVVDPGAQDPGPSDPGPFDPGTPDPGIQDPGQPDLGCVSSDQCPQGFFCDAPQCVPCETDDKCGMDCLPCEAPLFCKNGKCVECFITECGDGAWCDDGFCQPCTDDDPDHCGDDCEPCLGKYPACVAGECACEGDSCGGGKVCLEGDCADCNLDDHCGPDCLKCEAPTAHCLNGTCLSCALDEHCEGDLVCDGAGACVECVLHEHCDGGLFCEGGVCTDVCNTAQGCESDEGPDGEECGKAKIVGRKAALAGYVHNGDTTSDGDDDNLSFPIFQDKSECWDADADNFFRIYLYSGETLSATVFPDDQVDSMMKIYNGTGCENGGDDYQCIENGDRGDPDVLTGWTAPADGWYTLVVDGRRSMDDDHGPYKLEMSITCNDPYCCCGI